jgi:hypothetical protein
LGGGGWFAKVIFFFFPFREKKKKRRLIRVNKKNKERKGIGFVCVFFISCPSYCHPFLAAFECFKSLFALIFGELL